MFMFMVVAVDIFKSSEVLLRGLIGCPALEPEPEKDPDDTRNGLLPVFGAPELSKNALVA